MKSKAGFYGFSLVELGVIVLLIGIVSSVFYKFFEYFNKSEATDSFLLTLTDQKVRKFFFSNAFLPCPDIDSDGWEDRVSGNGSECQFNNGRVPYLSLNIDYDSSSLAKFRFAVNNYVTKNYGALTSPKFISNTHFSQYNKSATLLKLFSELYNDYLIIPHSKFPYLSFDNCQSTPPKSVQDFASASTAVPAYVIAVSDDASSPGGNSPLCFAASSISAGSNNQKVVWVAIPELYGYWLNH